MHNAQCTMHNERSGMRNAIFLIVLILSLPYLADQAWKSITSFYYHAQGIIASYCPFCPSKVGHGKVSPGTYAGETEASSGMPWPFR